MDDNFKSTKVKDEKDSNDYEEIDRLSSAEARLILHNLVSRKIIEGKDIKDALKLIKEDKGKENSSKSMQKKESSDKVSKDTVKKNISKRTKKDKIYRTRSVALQIAYDGTTHCGFTETMGLETPDNSIERHLFASLHKACLIKDRTSCNYSRAGRTDRGVSAHGQVVALMIRSAIPLNTVQEQAGNGINLPKNSFDEIEINIEASAKSDNKLKKESNTEETKTFITKRMKELDYSYILNNILPPSIRVLGWCPVDPEFSARFSASGRHYKYFFVKRNLNLDKMDKGLNCMVGKHDFRNLCKINAKEVYNFERVIYEAKVAETRGECGEANINSSILQDGNENSSSDGDKKSTSRQVCYMDIKGQAFLWHQIRCISALHFLIGKELEQPSLISTLLDINKNPRKPSYEMASDQPLVLHSCVYKNLKFGYTVKSLWNINQIWEKQWEEAMITAERIRDGINCLRQDAKIKLGDLKAHYQKFFVDKKPRRGKKRKVGTESNQEENLLDSLNLEWLPHHYEDLNNDTQIKWGEAMDLLSPCVQQYDKTNHVSIMKRAKGTSYEEKLHAIMSTARKRERYEVDVLQKRKSKQEDNEFYNVMTSYGGSAWD